MRLAAFPHRGQALRFAALAVILAAGPSCSNDSKPGPDADIIEAVQGNGQSAPVGTAVPIEVEVRVTDGQGDPVPGITVSFSVLTGGGHVASSTGVTNAAGIATPGDWTLGPTAGSNTLRAASTGLTGSPLTFTATGTAGSQPKLALIAQPASGQSNVTFSTQPVVELQTSSGTPILQAGVTLTASLATGSSFGALGGTTTAVTAGNGRATFSGLKLTGPVGVYTLSFTAPGFTAVAGSSINLSTVSGMVPLIDMGSRTYLGFTGGLFANGSNSMPAAHAAAGAARARAIERLDVNGNPSPSGKIVLMSVGFSNPSQEWCGVQIFPCNSWSFMGQALADPAVNHAELALVNGARGGEVANAWNSPTDQAYDRARDSSLAPRGLTEAQVQVVWIKTANEAPVTSLPGAGADAITLLTMNGDILRALKVRYPNLKMVFISSRIYAGYANTNTNPEPFAYENGFAEKWTIQAQIDQMANGGTIVDPRAGDLDYTTVAPWVSWGPYMWADGLNPRSDGLTWAVAEFQADGTHPDVAGETKVGAILLNFFKTDPRTSCWFLSGQTCP